MHVRSVVLYRLGEVADGLLKPLHVLGSRQRHIGTYVGLANALFGIHFVSHQQAFQ